MNLAEAAKSLGSGKSRILLLIPLVLSSFTHLWNPTGFPDLFYDEGAYMRRAVLVLQEHQVQENLYYYDHPQFGQILLAGLLYLSGYPHLADLSGSAESVESLYLAPKLWIGVLAVVDTFLIFQIVEKKYGNSGLAFMAAVLFAVMPSTWYTRRILLECLLLPLMLGSIALALRLQSKPSDYRAAALSGVCLGLAIYTKIPAFVIIPLVGFMIWNGAKPSRKRIILVWLIPVVFIPMLWPLQSLTTGTFNSWMQGVVGQTQRGQSSGIAGAFWALLNVDPILLVLGIAGFGYTVLLRRDSFLLLWVVPFLIFLSLIGYVQYFHILPILPAFCIAAALLLKHISERLKHTRIPAQVLPVAVAVFGFASTTILITTNVTSAQYEATSYALSLADNETTLVANPVYSWPYRLIYHVPHTFNDYRDVLFYQFSTDNVVLISEPHFLGSIHEPKLKSLYDRTMPSMIFEGGFRGLRERPYPFASLSYTSAGDHIEVRRGEVDKG